ncbi:MAG: prepilin-type N-terminal cleavage/methylation domain-containing protein [Geobacteraceae bacterium]|nr:prepilin-type N-terminal cleavage/methylation domain-containing protein [Geobacteraceae bacterium]
MRGFSLLEVMIALAIMSGVIMTVIVSFNYHLGIVVHDKEETAAVLLARTKIDDSGFPKLPAGKGDFSPQRPDILWEKSVTDTQLPGVQRMILAVSWDNGKRSLSLVRYAAKLL